MTVRNSSEGHDSAVVPVEPEKVASLLRFRAKQLRFLISRGETIDAEDLGDLAATFEVGADALAAAATPEERASGPSLAALLDILREVWSAGESDGGDPRGPVGPEPGELDGYAARILALVRAPEPEPIKWTSVSGTGMTEARWFDAPGRTEGVRARPTSEPEGEP